MQKYMYRRFLLFIPTLLMGSFLVFAILRILPGDIAVIILGSEEEQITPEALENLRQQLGLYDPLYMQYGKWLWSMFNGSFGGSSLVDSEPIVNMVKLRLPVTAELAVITVTAAFITAVPMGVVAAVTQDRWPDYLIRMFLVLGLSIPSFWFGILVLLMMLLWFRWVPPIIYQNLWENPWGNLSVMIWPAMVMAWHFAAYIARVTRSNVLEVMRQDYIRTAHSKGLKQNVILWRHVLRNALIPVVTVAGVYLGTLMGGTVVLEIVFNLPGIGHAVVNAVRERDYPVVQSLSMLFIFFVLFANLIVDLSYGFFDPRIKYS